MNFPIKLLKLLRNFEEYFCDGTKAWKCHGKQFLKNRMQKKSQLGKQGFGSLHAWACSRHPASTLTQLHKRSLVNFVYEAKSASLNPLLRGKNTKYIKSMNCLLKFMFSQTALLPMSVVRLHHKRSEKKEKQPKILTFKNILHSSRFFNSQKLNITKQ